MPNTPKSPRVAFLRTQYLPRLEKAFPVLSSTWGGMNEKQIFDALLKADPTPKKQTLERLLNWTLKGDLLHSDLAETTSAISVFEHTKKNFSTKPRDLNRYKLRADFVAATLAGPLARFEKLMDADNRKEEREWVNIPNFPKDGSISAQAWFALKITLAHDPAHGGNLEHFLRWFEHPDEPLLPEDLWRITDDLLTYRQYRQRLAPGKRDLSQYATSRDFQNVIWRYNKLPPFTVAELQDMEDHEIAMGRATEIAKGPNWRLIQIQTESAAIELGKGTQWCTAMTGSRTNYFDKYKNNLLYLCDDKADRYMFHFETFQFRDRYDRMISEPYDFVKSYDGLDQALSPYVSEIKYDYNRLLEWIDTQHYHSDMYRGTALMFTLNEESKEKAARIIPFVLKESVCPRSEIKSGGMGIHAVDENGERIPDYDFRLTAHLLETCRDVPEWKQAAETVLADVLPALLRIPTDPNFSSFFGTKLMKKIKGDAFWENIIREALPAIQVEAQRKGASTYLREIEEIYADNPALRKTRPTTMISQPSP